MPTATSEDLDPEAVEADGGVASGAPKKMSSVKIELAAVFIRLPTRLNCLQTTLPVFPTGFRDRSERKGLCSPR
jgi:hypothetical protein